MQTSNRIDLAHNSLRFRERDDDSLVVFDVVVVERSAFSIFQPFLRGLVAADVEFPGGLRDAVEILRFVDVDFAVLILHLVNKIASGNGIGRSCAVKQRAFEQMELRLFGGFRNGMNIGRYDRFYYKLFISFINKYTRLHGFGGHGQS